MPEDEDGAKHSQAAALEDLTWSLRALAANILRVVRGAGSAATIGREAVALIDSFEAYRVATGIYPSSYEITAALALSEPAGAGRDWDFAKAKLIRGALQAAASDLLGQRTQQVAGERELLAGIDQIGSLRNQDAQVARSPATDEAYAAALGMRVIEANKRRR